MISNPSDMTDQQLQEILERSHGATGDKLLVLTEQAYRGKKRIEKLETELAEAQERLDSLDSFDGCVLFAEALLDGHYPKDTIVCSTNPEADIGAQVTGNLRELIERMKTGSWRERAEEAEAENKRLREGLRRSIISGMDEQGFLHKPDTDDLETVAYHNAKIKGLLD